MHTASTPRPASSPGRTSAARHRLIRLAALLIVALLMAACGSPADGDEDTTADVSQESDQPDAPAEDDPEEASADDEPTGGPWSVNIQGGPLGGATYLAAVALAEVINDHAPDVSATVLEGGGGADNALELARRSELRENTIIVSNPFVMAMAEFGDGPFEEAYDGQRILGAFWPTATFLVTLDSGITGPEDLPGRSISITGPGLVQPMMEPIFTEHGWDIADEVDLLPLGFDDAKNGLIDGTLDVGTLAGSRIAGEWFPNPATLELLESGRDITFIDIPADLLASLEESTGYPFPAFEAPPGALFAGQEEPVGTLGFYQVWAVDQDMDDGLVAAVTEALYEHSDELGEYSPHLRQMTGEVLVDVPDSVIGSFHPAAEAYYRSQGHLE